jgi:hypothetical protein
LFLPFYLTTVLGGEPENIRLIISPSGKTIVGLDDYQLASFEIRCVMEGLKGSGTNGTAVGSCPHLGD